MKIAQSGPYTIVRYNREFKEWLAETHIKDLSTFCVATNKAHRFNTPHQASIFFRAAKINGLVGCSVFIEGPRGGTYHISNGKPQY